jgi:hypothetical protein
MTTFSSFCREDVVVPASLPLKVTTPAFHTSRGWGYSVSLVGLLSRPRRRVDVNLFLSVTGSTDYCTALRLGFTGPLRVLHVKYTEKSSSTM